MFLYRPARRVTLTTLALLAVGTPLLWHPAKADEQPTSRKEPTKAGILFTLPEDPKKTPDDLKALQGTWQAVSLEHNGEKATAEAVKNFRVVIRDNAITFESDGHKHEATFLLLTATRPKAIWLKAQPKDPVVRAIYELVGDRLTICVDNDKGTAMPTEFAAKAESGLTLMVLEHEPATKKIGDMPQPKEKRYSFAFDKQRWIEVFEWLTYQTELPFISPNIPTGTFSFTPPAGKTYTISEVIDILNDALLNQPENCRWLLLRRTHSFTVKPADQKVDPATLRLVSLDDLASLGRTEIVRIQFRLEWGASAKDIAPIVEKMLSEWGGFLYDEDHNTLIISDMAGHLRPVARLIADLEREANTP